MPSLADYANAIANLPEVLPRVAAGYDGVDLTPFFAKPENFAFGDEDGVVLFGWVEPGVFEGHYLFSPTVPKRKLLAMCRLSLRAVFTLRGASSIVGHTPADDIRARVITRALGFTRQGTSVSPSGRSCVDYTLERATWATLSAESLAA